MIEAALIRSTDNGIETIGKLYVTGGAVYACDTLERPYVHNQRGISCIPAGKYICKKVEASTHIPYPHISVTGVTGRDGICIHKGNLFSDSEGCILVGKGFGDINRDGQSDILNSKNTFDELMKLLPDQFVLTITEAQNINS